MVFTPACAEDDHRDTLASLVSGDRHMREMGQVMDRTHREALRKLGHPPRDDLDFRHQVAQEVLKRLRAGHRTDCLPGLTA